MPHRLPMDSLVSHRPQAHKTSIIKLAAISVSYVQSFIRVTFDKVYLPPPRSKEYDQTTLSLEVDGPGVS
ncbi:hypothetical protein T03_6848 [Trichinella britovi]|uniref:Uncharacterized protein n=1 Tax=Trichinella britovi TaxID=45882 RepID=A0A0V1CEJ8_TRIBR|nr:hypothetical protein T03_6848 [Trichinella britovi]